MKPVCIPGTNQVKIWADYIYPLILPVIHLSRKLSVILCLVLSLLNRWYSEHYLRFITLIIQPKINVQTTATSSIIATAQLGLSAYIVSHRKNKCEFSMSIRQFRDNQGIPIIQGVNYGPFIRSPMYGPDNRVF